MSFDSFSETINELLSVNTSIDYDVAELCVRLARDVSEKSTGFAPDQLTEIFQKILELNIDIKQKCRLLHEIIPSELVTSECLSKILVWVILKYTQEEFKTVIRSIFQWIIASIIYGFAKVEDIRHFNFFLLKMVDIPTLEGDVCHLLYRITDHSSVSKLTVQKILNAENKSPVKIYFKALLSLYQRLKPHLLDNTECCFIDEIKMFPRLPKKLQRKFEKSAKTKNIVFSLKRIPFSDFIKNLIAFKRHNNVYYIAEMTPNEIIRECKTSQLLENGTMFDSFIENKYGFIYLALMNTEIQKAFNSYIDNILSNRNEKYINNKYLLKLARIQCFYRQELISIRKFILKKYTELEKCSYLTVLKLLECLVIDRINDFLNIFKYLFKRSIKEDINYACQILIMFTNLIRNNVNYLETTMWILTPSDNKTSIEGIVDAFSSFKYFSLYFTNIFYKTPKILHQIVDCHLNLFNCNLENIGIHNIIPSEIAHRILINSDYILVNKLFRIVSRNMHLYPDKLTMPIEIYRQAEDLLKIFFMNINISSIFSQRSIITSFDKLILENPKANGFLRLRHNFTFMPLTHLDDQHKYMSEMENNELEDKLNIHCPSIMQVLFTFLKHFPEILTEF